MTARQWFISSVRAWFGAMFYSHLFLQRRARAFFTRDADFEAFIATISHGARWLVLCALGVLAVTGSVLLVTGTAVGHSPAWWMLIVGKWVLFLAAFGLFIHISWRMWPARLFATAAEVSHVQRSFRRVAWVMLALAALSMMLGVLVHVS